MKSGRILAALCILFIIGVAPILAQAPLPRVAVLPFSPLQVSRADAEILTGLFETALVKSGAFDIIEQNRISEILAAQEYSLADCTDEACAVNLGRLLAAEQIILGTCSSLGGRYVLNAKIIDVAQGRNLKADKVDADTLAALADGAEELANKLAGQTALQLPAGFPSAAEPAVAAPREPQYSELFIETDPAGAEVYIDGVMRGTSPELMSRIPRGRIRVEARKGGLYAVEDVELSATVTRLRLTLRELRGNLFIKASDPDVRVLLDGRDIGRLGGGLFEKQPAGSHTLELKGKGLYWKGDIQVAVDESTRVEAVLREYGDLRYRLPEGVSAEVTGPGFSRTVTGSGTIALLDTGSYTASFSGENWVPAREAFEVKRGTRLEITPNLVRTRDYEENMFLAALSEVSAGIQGGLALEKLPGALEKLKREVSGSRYPFENIQSRIDGLSVRLQEQIAAQNVKKFSDEVEKYHAGLVEKRTTDRDVRNFEKRLEEAEPMLSGSPLLITRARALLGDMRLQVLSMYRDGLVQKQERAAAARKGLRHAGWITLGVGVIFGGIAGLSWYLADQSSSDSRDAATQAEADRLRAVTQTLETVTWSGAAAGGVCAGFSILCWSLAPNPVKYDSRIAAASHELELQKNRP